MKDKYRNVFPAYKFILLIIFLFKVTDVYAQDTEEMPLFYEIIPGGTHFYEGDTVEGLAFLGAEVFLSACAIGINSRLNGDEVKELNVPFILAGQVYSVDKWRYFQKNQARSRAANRYNGIGFDKSPLPTLLKAPFEPELISSTFVITFALLGIADGIIAYPSHGKRYSDISTVHAFGHHLNRNKGTIYYETSSMALSYGAAVSEEMIFRGILLPVLDYNYGKRTGLITSSLVFGVLHLTNPDIDRPFYYLSQATLAGLALAWNVQQNDYSLGKAIAAHFWYDFASMTTTWIMNPRENPLGLSVGFKF